MEVHIDVSNSGDCAMGCCDCVFGRVSFKWQVDVNRGGDGNSVVVDVDLMVVVVVVVWPLDGE